MSEERWFWMLFILSGLSIISLAISCRPPDMDTYLIQQEAAEKRASAFKQGGNWTPTSMRAFAKSLKSEGVLPQQALAEMGVIVLDNLSISTVRTAVETMAATVENCGGKK